MEERNRESKHIIFSYYRISRTREFIESFRAERSWAALQERLRVRRRDRRRAIGRRLSAAAVAVLCLGGGLWTWQRPKAEEPAVRAEACLFPERGGQAAFLTLADGREIDLSEQEGEIEQGGASNLNRELSYRRSEGGEANSCTSFHTLTVPRGGEYRLMLADGSRVWMNAGSRLRYPERFGRSREVYLTGEAYFEVAKDSCRPFRVHTEDYGVEVLGTRFNVTAYADETGRATLAGGSIKVTRGGRGGRAAPERAGGDAGGGDTGVPGERRFVHVVGPGEVYFPQYRIEGHRRPVVEVVQRGHPFPAGGADAPAFCGHHPA